MLSEHNKSSLFRLIGILVKVTKKACGLSLLVNRNTTSKDKKSTSQLVDCASKSEQRKKKELAHNDMGELAPHRGETCVQRVHVYIVHTSREIIYQT